MTNYNSGKLLKLIINSCIYDDDIIKCEAGACLSNIILLNDDDIIHLLVSNGIINALKFIMKTSSKKLPLLRCIESFDIIMSKTKKRDLTKNDYIYKIEQCGVLEIFDILKAGVDNDDDVYNAACNIVWKYWIDYGYTYKPLPIIFSINYYKNNILNPISKKLNLLFDIKLIRNYLYKRLNKKTINFKINKKISIIITTILQQICNIIISNSTTII